MIHINAVNVDMKQKNKFFNKKQTILEYKNDYINFLNYLCLHNEINGEEFYNYFLKIFILKPNVNSLIDFENIIRLMIKNDIIKEINKYYLATYSDKYCIYYINKNKINFILRKEKLKNIFIE